MDKYHLDYQQDPLIPHTKRKNKIKHTRMDSNEESFEHVYTHVMYFTLCYLSVSMTSRAPYI